MEDLRDRVELVVRQVVREVLAARSGELELDRFMEPADRWGVRRPLVAANWKMNMTASAVRDYAARLDPRPDSGVEVVICPPAVLLPVLVAALGPDSPVRAGAQNLHPESSGAYTGEHSPQMLRDAGADYAILGHSERRALFSEDDAVVRSKVAAALGAGLRPIVCVGERLEEREAGATFRVLRSQLSGALGGLVRPAPDPSDVVVAYEPVWAIGTGRTATADQAQEAVEFVRQRLSEMFGWRWAEQARLLYGGSASPDNAEELASRPDVDGFLVGGAGLDPDALGTMIALTCKAKSDERGSG